MKRKFTAILLLICMVSALTALCCCASGTLPYARTDPRGAMMAHTVRLCALEATETAAPTDACVLPCTVWQTPGAQQHAHGVCAPQAIAVPRDERARTLALLCRRMVADPDPDGT